MIEWFIFFLIIQVIHFLGTWKLYVKAGRKPWEALIPIYNGIILMKILKRPSWWVILLFIPIINLLMFPVIWVETVRSFGKSTLMDIYFIFSKIKKILHYLFFNNKKNQYKIFKFQDFLQILLSFTKKYIL